MNVAGSAVWRRNGTGLAMNRIGGIRAMFKIGVELAIVLGFLLPTGFGHADMEVLEILGELTFVDYDRGQITVLSVDGKEAIFDITDETEIVYIDPDTEDEESMALEDLEPGFAVWIRYVVQDEANLAQTIEIRSLGLGSEDEVLYLRSPSTGASY
jgi:hypothetical protein